jgi:rod shape-determining protein MreD
VTVALRVAPLVFVAAVVQVSGISGARVLGAEPDLMLVVLVAIGLLRGSIAGASAGFAGGLLVDSMTLGTLGVTSIELTIAGYWIGRYGETTGQGRAYAPPLAAFAASVGVALGGVALHYLLGETVAAREAAVALLPSAALAALLAVPVTALCRRLLGTALRPIRGREVSVV